MSFCGLDSQRPCKAENQIRYHVNTFEICGGQKGILTVCTPSTTVLPRQYHSTNTAHSS
jgi:hypothetical protein